MTTKENKAKDEAKPNITQNSTDSFSCQKLRQKIHDQKNGAEKGFLQICRLVRIPLEFKST